MKKNAVIYSSLTGNTKKVGLAIADALNIKAYDVKEINNVDEFDKIIFGFYVDKGLMDPEAKRVAKLIKDRNVGLFMTLGANPNTEHAKDCLLKVKNFLEKNNNKVTNEFMCQGAIDPNLIEKMKEMAAQMGDKAFHKITPEREETWRLASTHPDENDLKNAVLAFKDF